MEITNEVARIHAHVCGDGSVYTLNVRRCKSELIAHKRKNIFRKEYCIEYYNDDLTLIKEFIKDFKIAFDRNKKTVRNKIIFNGAKHIIEKLELSNKNSYSWHIPNFILKAPLEVKFSWIRAFFDDEAYIHPSRKRILVKCMNRNGLEQISSILLESSIKNNITGPNCDNSYYLVIYKEGLFSYREKIGFLMQRKAQLLNEILNNMGREELP